MPPVPTDNPTTAQGLRSFTRAPSALTSRAIRGHHSRQPDTARAPAKKPNNAAMSSSSLKRVLSAVPVRECLSGRQGEHGERGEGCDQLELQIGVHICFLSETVGLRRNSLSALRAASTGG